MAVFQDTMDLLHHARTAGDRGTLEQVRNFFGHRSVKHNVMANYQHVADLLEVRVSYWYGQSIFPSVSTKGVLSINNFIFLFQYWQLCAACRAGASTEHTSTSTGKSVLE